MSIGQPIGRAPSTITNYAPMGLVRTAKYFPQGAGQPAPFTALPANGTVACVWTLEDDFDLIRFMFANDATAETSTVTAFAYAVSASMNDGINPVDAAGAPVAWTLATFNNAGADLRPDQNVAGSTTTLVIDAVTNVSVPIPKWSDWVRVPSLPRTDGGFGRLLFVRQYTAAATVARTPYPGTSRLDPWNRICRGRDFKSWVKFGNNGVSSPASFTAPDAYGYVIPLAVQYYGRARGATLSVHGDSITQGLWSTSDHAGWPFLAASALSSAGRPIQLFNQGIPSQTGPNVYANAMATLGTVKPDVMAIITWTPNDSQSQANSDLAWSRAVEVAEYARTLGTVPILITPIPSSGTSTTTEVYRMSCVTRALEAQQRGMLVCDMNAVLSNGANPARIIPAYDTDGIHPNDAGYAAMAAAFIPVLKRALGI